MTKCLDMLSKIFGVFIILSFSSTFYDMQTFEIIREVKSTGTLKTDIAEQIKSEINMV